MNQAQRLAMAQRLAARSTQATRPVPLDKAAIGQAVTEMVAAVMRTVSPLPDDVPVGNQNIYLDTLRLRNPRGEDADIILVVMSRPGHGSDLLLNAGFGKSPLGDHISIQLNGSLTPPEFRDRRRELKDKLWRNTIHELTHALDLTRGQDSGSVAPKTMDEWVRYFNLPREVRAYMQEIVDQVLQTVPRGYSGKVDPQLVNRGLMRSRTWQEIGQLFNQANRKKILQAVYAAVSDALSMGRAASVQR